MARFGSFGVAAVVAFGAGVGGAQAAESSSGSTNPLLGGLTAESKCQILVDAMRDNNQTVINEGANAVVVSLMEHFDVIREKFGEREAQQLLERSFKGCLSHPDETIFSQARASFQSILQEISQPGYGDEPGLDDVAVPADVQATAAKLQAILPNGPVALEASITRTSSTRPGHPVTFVVKPSKSGTTRVQEVYSPSFVMDREELGPVQLKSKNNQRGFYGPQENERITITTALALTASTWVAGASFSFDTEMSGGAGHRKTSCTIGQSVEAKTVHPTLEGHAWPLQCEDASWKESGYYIEELRYFLVMHSQSDDLGASDYAIDRIEITR
ncbi:hypothetical protein ATY78_02655 [Rhizobium sp. R635]|uniref:hypothetical protein n=1 Tax=Rhizobium sp. R635 TaxID=1764275 RepID=UPI000B535DEF|nr:hypothetical protein [Rhizobium sp. R635]OWV92449.1 hypothetical protein ATY78_02655 [Rhizobium sp. R635]